ncbi:MAG: 1-deoxy-D-xylulose-5-phosphate synthase, partial [Bdellovibrionota bacterium]
MKAAALKNSSLNDLGILAAEIRQKILSTSLKNGGHLGASLGAVELAIALHYVFDSPEEPIVWDVGHQAYAHKLLTGRWERFETLRQKEGISGFLSREESEHDVFGAGHSSTALSAALAMSWASPDRWSIAVVGDGGLTAGLAFEALNNLRATVRGPLLIVLNDNQMSISENVGSVSALLAGGRGEELFQPYGLRYVGPLDGHDLSALIGTLRGIKADPNSAPILVHAITQKGKGYAPAEESPASYHGVSPIPAKVPAPSAKSAKTYSQVFGEAMIELAARDPKIVAITAAMPDGTGLLEFARKFPDRFFDVGIAEPHAVTFAAGLATRGFRPVVAIYSTFLQRALDSAIHDVAIQNLGVTFAIDRAGLVGADGPTHHGAFDLAYLGMIPGMSVTAPTSYAELRSLLEMAVESGKPWAIRYPRGSGPERAAMNGAEFSNAQAIVVALGSAAARASKALALCDPQGDRVAFAQTGWAKPISRELIEQLRLYPKVPLLIAEDGSIRGGFGQELLYQL